MSMRGSPPKDVDEYLAGVPEDARAVLSKLRKTIRAAAPKATEVISYQIPSYKYNGMVVSFAAFKEHLSLFVGTLAIKAFKDDLKDCETSKGTIRFTVDKPLPAALVTKIVKARIAENEKKRNK